MQNNYLIEMDSQNRAKALMLQNWIVEAPAGAGKTELLTQRYLKLLTTVQSPEEIVALTFTNKAATEMRNRILQSLEAAQQNAPIDAPHKKTTRDLANAALQHAHNLGWQLLAQPARLRIQTMDALCSSLARQMPLLSRFGGQPRVSDDAAAHYQTAAQLALASIAYEKDSDGIVSTALGFMHNDIEKLTQLLANMLAMRDQWLPLIGEHADVSVETISANILQAVNSYLEQRLKSFLMVISADMQQQLMPIVRFAASHVDENHALKTLIDWQIPLTANVADLGDWQILCDFLLTNDGTFRKKLDKNNGFPPKEKNPPEYDQFKVDFLALTQTLGQPDPFNAIRNLPNLNTADIAKNARITKALAQLLKLATALLWATFQTANEVDFVAIAQSASYALENEKGVTDLALKLDYQISHLLVDEFQDTSPTQMRLIEQLTAGWQPDDGHTLFCVGDPMQSIYRFRKADVSLFLSAAQFGIGQLPLGALKLNRNNRSHPSVVDWINTNFSPIFPPIDNITQAAISYRPFIATKNSIADEGVAVHALTMHADEESANAKLQEAHMVAQLIAQEETINPQNNIAVLVRSRSHLRELVSIIRREYPALNHFQAVNIERLNDRQTVLDALSLTRAMLHRADRVHWLNILRAPWCGLTLHDLHALAGDNHRATIWQLMQEPARLQTLSADGQQRLAHVHAVLAEAFANDGRMPLRRWCESTWLKLGGGSTLISAGDNRDVQAFFDLVEKIARGLTLDFTQLDTAMLNLFAQPDINANNRLQFLTIHAAKGLEFDCVILPALNRKPRIADAPLMLWEEINLHPETLQTRQLIAAPYSKNKSKKANLYDFLNTLETERAHNETARLLYVAATRAVKKLHLIATVKATKNGEVKPTAQSLLSLLWPAIQNQFSAEPTTAIETENSAQLADFSAPLCRLTAPAVPKLLGESTTQFVPENNFYAQNKPPATLLNLDADAGTLAHLYMELIIKTGLQHWPASRISACAPSMLYWLTQKGHAESAAQKRLKFVINALITSTNSADGQWLLQARDSNQPELSITALNALDAQNAIQEHRTDLTFIEKDATTKTKTRWIIDYKLTFFDAEKDLSNTLNNDLNSNINNHLDDDLSHDLTTVAQQYHPQLQRYALLFKDEQLPIQTAIFFLAEGKLIKLNSTN